MGVFPAPPFPLTTATVRGPGQWRLMARTSARSARSVSLGLERMPRRVHMPLIPVCAGSTTS